MLYWYWFIIAGALLVIEMLSLTTFFLFFAIGAGLMGCILALVPDMALNMQLGLAGIFAIVAMIAGYYTFKSRTSRKYTDNINNRMTQHIGTEILLLQDAENGVSKAKIGDTHWRVLVDEGKKGDLVKIIDFKSTSFIAENDLNRADTI